MTKELTFVASTKFLALQKLPSLFKNSLDLSNIDFLFATLPSFTIFTIPREDSLADRNPFPKELKEDLIERIVFYFVGRTVSSYAITLRARAPRMYGLS